jgi:hypothetical protein
MVNMGARRAVRRGTRPGLLGVALVSALAALFVALAVRASAAPTPSSLTFEGAHFVDPAFPGGLRHDGRFTASAPFCPAGRAYDVRHFESDMGLDVLRMHTCDDGSGTFTAFIPRVIEEHGGRGTWKIVDGTGRYETLRGFGTYTATRISGDPDVFETIVYRTNWQGTVDFDAAPPAVEAFTVTARKLRKRPRTYTLRIRVAARDTATPVRYTVDVRAGRALLAFKQRSSVSGQSTMTFRIRLSRAVRTLRVELAAEDALGNAGRASRSVGLRG